MPGVVLLDHVLARAEDGFDWTGPGCRIPWVKFLRPLLPGQQVLLGLEAVSQEEVRFTCRIGEARVAEGILMLERTPSHE